MASRYEKDSYYQAIGAEISRRREEAGLTLVQLADLARLNKSTVQNAEQGSTCSVFVLDRLAVAFDCLMDELVPVGEEARCSARC